MQLEVQIGERYEINLPKHDRNGQVVTVFHDSAHLGGNEIVRSHCIVEDESGHRFMIRKLCLSKWFSHEETVLLYENGYCGVVEGDDNHIALGDTSMPNQE